MDDALAWLPGWMRRAWNVYVLIAAADFMTCWYVGGRYGEAWDGKVVAGHWFLGEHGHFTEVSRQIWNEDRIWMDVTFSCWGVVGIVSVLLLVRLQWEKWRRRETAT